MLDSAVQPPNRVLGVQSDEFVFTIAELETIGELHEVGTTRIPGGYPGDSARLSGERGTPVVLHANGVADGKPASVT
jgi:hypothetical protein